MRIVTTVLTINFTKIITLAIVTEIIILTIPVNVIMRLMGCPIMLRAIKLFITVRVGLKLFKQITKWVIISRATRAAVITVSVPA